MKPYALFAFCLALLCGSSVYAAQPTNINYSGKGTTFGGESYRLYTVRCSNGKKYTITKWKERKNKWCVGKASEKSCGGSQLKAAQSACRR